MLVKYNTGNNIQVINTKFPEHVDLCKYNLLPFLLLVHLIELIICVGIHSYHLSGTNATFRKNEDQTKCIYCQQTRKK